MSELSPQARRFLAQATGDEASRADEARVRDALEDTLGVVLPAAAVAVTLHSVAATGAAAASSTVGAGAVTGTAVSVGGTAAVAHASTVGVGAGAAASVGGMMTATGAAAAYASTVGVAAGAAASVGGTMTATGAAAAYASTVGVAAGTAASVGGTVAAAGAASTWVLVVAGVLAAAGGSAATLAVVRATEPVPPPAVVRPSVPRPVIPAATPPMSQRVASGTPVDLVDPPDDVVQAAVTTLPTVDVTEESLGAPVRPSSSADPTSSDPSAHSSTREATTPLPKHETEASGPGVARDVTPPVPLQVPGSQPMSGPGPVDTSLSPPPLLQASVKCGDVALRDHLARAEAALEAGEANDALTLLDGYYRRCPSGEWDSRAWRVRTGALCVAGRLSDAAALVDWFVSEHGRDEAVLAGAAHWCPPSVFRR